MGNGAQVLGSPIKALDAPRQAPQKASGDANFARRAPGWRCASLLLWQLAVKASQYAGSFHNCV